MNISLRLQKGWRGKLLKTLVSFAHGIFFRHAQKFSVADMESPKRILVLNGAHIGDIVITTSILPVLRSAYPSAEIGFMAGSWSSMVLKHHPDIAFSHCIDHWRINRNGKSLLNRYMQYRKTYKVALCQIRKIRYDLAICIYPYAYADFMYEAWRAGIPIRLGFENSLFASFASAAVEVPQNPFLHQGAMQAEVLRPLRLAQMHLEKRKAILPDSTDEAIQEVCRLVKVSSISDARYRIIHIGTGAPHRELSVDFWRQLAEALSKTHTLVFTGHGPREAAQIAQIVDGLDYCINACNSLSWNGFVAAVRHADTLYGIESMAGHVAGAVGTRCIVVYTGIGGLARWRPEGPVTVMTNNLECAPCDRAKVCESMACIRGIVPQDLVNLG